MANNETRRSFITKTVTATAGLSIGVPAFSAAQAKKIIGANDKIRVGFIGVGGRGTGLLHGFMANDDVEVAALCDVFDPCKNRVGVSKRVYLPEMGEKFPNKVERYKDFRKMLEQKDIDTVCIATPDHWHAIQCIQSVEAGKDVYCEKPLSKTIKEGRAMVDAQKRTGKVVQVGLNRRGAAVYQKLSKDIQGGKIGKVVGASAFRISNMFPDGIGNLKAEDPPAGLNWNMWLGPRAYRPYQYNIAPYYFRWWSDYSSQMGNWGVHYMDVIRWMMGEKAPSAITANGGKFVLTDDRDIPDTMEVQFEFESGAIVKFSIYEASSGTGVVGNEIELRGTKGTLVANSASYRIIPSRPGQRQTWDKLIEEEEWDIEKDKTFGDLNIGKNSTGNLIRNFLDCVKSRKEPWCPLEEGHRSTSFAHLANISLAMGERLEWDAKAEKFTNNEKANELLHYEYRKPWKL